MKKHMNKLRLWFLGLSLGAFLNCGGDPTTTHSLVVMTINSMPPDGVHMRVTVSNNGKIGNGEFFRNDSNKWVTTQGSHPAMTMAPSTIDIALDLPPETSGRVIVNITVECPDQTMPMPGTMPTVHECGTACVATDIESGQTLNVSTAISTGTATCPS